MNTERWVSADEISEHLGITTETLYRWIADRGLPGHRVGRLWKFKRTQVDAWVESGDANAGKAEVR